MGSSNSSHSHSQRESDIFCLGVIPKAHKSQIRFLTVTANNRYLISAADDLSINIYFTSIRKKIHEFKNVHTSKITSLSVSQNGIYLASTSQDMSLIIYDLQKLKIYHKFQLTKKTAIDRLTSATFTPDSRLIIVGSFDGSITIFAIQKKQKLRSILHAHDSSITSLQVTQDGALLISASLDNFIRIFRLKKLQKVSSMHHIVKGQILCCNAIISAEERNTFLSMEDFSLITVDLAKHTLLPLIGNGLDKFNSVCISKDFKYLVLLINGTSIHIYDFQLRKKLFEMTDADIQCFTMTAKGDLIILGYTDGSIKYCKNPVIC